jgi:hypothetical protein
MQIDYRKFALSLFMWQDPEHKNAYRILGSKLGVVQCAVPSRRLVRLYNHGRSENPIGLQ